MPHVYPKMGGRGKKVILDPRIPTFFMSVVINRKKLRLVLGCYREFFYKNTIYFKGKLI